MSVHCAVCGEELLGAVNRCWRCGARMELPPGDPDLPPVRPDAVPIAGAELPGEICDANLADGEAASPQARVTVTARRVGSPFAAGAELRPARTTAAEVPDWMPRLPQYPRDAAAAGGATAALLLGVLSLVCSFFTVGALVLAVLGIGMGIWGSYSVRRGQAIAGLLLCCVALAISGFQAVVLLYQLQYGIKPWELPEM